MSDEHREYEQDLCYAMERPLWAIRVGSGPSGTKWRLYARTECGAPLDVTSRLIAIHRESRSIATKRGDLRAGHVSDPVAWITDVYERACGWRPDVFSVIMDGRDA